MQSYADLRRLKKSYADLRRAMKSYIRRPTQSYAEL